MQNIEGQPLGYCDECDRMRWLAAVVDQGSEGGGTPHGCCRTCERALDQERAAMNEQWWGEAEGRRRLCSEVTPPNFFEGER